MDFSKLKRNELLLKCQELNLTKYKSKTKKELIDILTNKMEQVNDSEEIINVKNTVISETSQKSNKKNKGQFYTTNNDYILDGLCIPEYVDKIIEPFAGNGDLVEWSFKQGKSNVVCFDIEPKQEYITERDTLKNPPDYSGCWIITNPPYLARNKCENKQLFDMYDTNDLYKCFIKSITGSNKCDGGIIIIPAGFFFSPRNIDVECRNDFMRTYRILTIKYFEETVFNDTSTTVVVVMFEKSTSIMETQNVKWIMMPSNKEKLYMMDSRYDWIIGGDIYYLPQRAGIKISRHVEHAALKTGEQQTFMTLSSLDSGKEEGKINLEYKKNYVYPAKDCSRTYATLRVSGIVLTETQQIELSTRFNEFLGNKRDEYWSLFLPQFRESKEYARKRIPFELAYKILGHLILSL